MRLTRIGIAAVLFVTPAFVTPAFAWDQYPEGSPTRPAPFESLEDGQWVRVVGAFGHGEGRVLEHTTGDLTLSSERQPLRIAATSVDTLWTRGRGTLVGALVGGLVGLGLGAAVAASAGELEDTPPEFVWGVAMGAGAVGGGVMGALIGSSMHIWKRRYP